MASNMSTLGFDYQEQAEFAEAMSKLAGEAVERLTCRDGEYAIWRSRTGAELWFHLSAPGEEGEREILGLTPYFEGRSDNLVNITQAIARPEDNPLEGAFYAWMSPEPESGEGAYPIVFDAVDFAAHKERELPLLVGVRLAGFARELRAFPSAEAYSASTMAEDGKRGLAPEAFIPMGLFAAASGDGSGQASEAPSSTAILTGRVKEHEVLTNEETGQKFVWLLVDSLEGTFDLVADPTVVSGDITVGGTVECACWLFGRVLG